MSRKARIIFLIIMIFLSAAIVSSSLLFGSETTVLSVIITQDGKLKAQTIYDNITDKVYKLFWETDAGTLTGDVVSVEQSGNTGFYCYSGLDDEVTWSGDDTDGNKYTSATIKVHVYEERIYDIFGMAEYEIVKSFNITINYNEESGLIEEAETLRVFGNPIRAGNDSDWQEIYKLYENKDDDNNYIVLRYRTGNEIKRTDSILWETNAAPFSKTSFSAIPTYSPAKDVSNKRVLKNTETTCFNIKNFDNFFFTNESKNTGGTANIKISAFVASGSDEKYKAFYTFDIK